MPEDNVKSTYVCQLNIERSVVTHTMPQPQRGLMTPERSVKTEGVKATLRASSLEALTAKVNKYLAIVDDEDFGDTRVTRGSD